MKQLQLICSLGTAVILAFFATASYCPSDATQYKEDVLDNKNKCNQDGVNNC